VLSVEATGPDEIVGTFEFYDVDGTVEGFEPVPYGAFHLSGTYSGHVLDIQPGDWAQDPEGRALQPPNYEPVPMVNFEPAPIDPNLFFGTFPTQEGCTVFEFRRTADEPYGESEEAEEAAAEYDFARPEAP
jgi:hypothetical protein